MSNMQVRPQECVHEETVSHWPSCQYSGHTIQHQCAFRLLQRDHKTVFMKIC